MQRILTGVCAVLLLVTAPALARDMEWKGSGGWGAGLPYGQEFNPKRIQSASGEIYRMERLVPQSGMAEGISLIVRADLKLIPVHLGPKWYLERQDFPLNKGDAIEVVGSRVPFDGEEVLIASEIRTKDKVLRLREANGLPLWSAWRAK